MKCFAAKAVILTVLGACVFGFCVGLAGFYGLLKEERYYTIEQQEFYSNGVRSAE